MRPKKKILLYDANLVRLRVQEFLLRTRGPYDVRTAETLDGAERIAACVDVAAVVMVLPSATDVRRIAAYRRAPVLAIGPLESLDVSDAEMVLSPKVPTAMLLRCVGSLAKRKRGPKRKEPVAMSPHAVMGAEMLDPGFRNTGKGANDAA